MMDTWWSRDLIRCPLLLLAALLVSASQLYAVPQALSDSALNVITAGTTGQSDSGSLILSYGSSAVLHKSKGLHLNGTVQSEAKAFNLVNSSASAVVNAANIWVGEGVAATGLGVTQLNQIVQLQQSSAALYDYARSDTDNHLQTDTQALENLETQSSLLHQKTDLRISNHSTENNSTATVDTSLDLSLGVPGTDLALFEYESNLGQGVAVAGELAATLDGGSAEIIMMTGVSLTAEPAIKVGDYFDAGVKLSADASLALKTKIELPKLDMQITGAGCGTVLGSCSSSGTLLDLSVEVVDLSTLDSSQKQSTGSRQFSETKTWEYRSPFALGSAEAEYIVVDDASLVLESDEMLELTDQAQSHAKGMNLVNAVGSSVANVVNLSRLRQVNYNGELVLTQFNFVTHGQ